ncbi:MAG: signal peptide peptidase SppA [Polyangiales bacterium]
MLAALTANAVRGAFYPLLLARRGSLVPKGAWVELTLDGPVTELERPMRRFRSPRELLMGGPAAKPPTTVAAVRELCEAIAEDGDVGGLLLTVRNVGCGSAVATSLRDAFLALRAAGKKVVAWLPDGASTREYVVAVAADKVLATPQATVAPLGYAAGMTFLRSLLARGGVEAEVFARREYKSAAEAFTRDSFSEANRRQTEALLDRAYEAAVRAIAEGRKVDPDRARRAINEGPWRAPDAVREGLLDATAYDDELATHLDNAPKRVPARAYLALARAMRFRPLGAERRVGVVEVRGPIVSEAGMAFGAVADARRITGALRAAREDRSLGAVVLHVDTRGGSALASDVIAREVERLREKKPVVAYFADVAASGGYYVSALAREIVAQPLTVTGSIGVIALRLTASRALEKVGVNHEVIRRGERADLGSPFRALDDGDRAAFDREIDGLYDDFVGVVARGRGRPAGEVEPLARGRVYAGVDAHAVGLVDHLGGLDVALARARALDGGRFAPEPVVVTPPRHTPPPAEAPAPVRAALAAFGDAAGSLDLLTLLLSSPHDHLFAWEDAPGL